MFFWKCSTVLSLSLSLLMVQVAFYLFLRHFMSRQPSVFSSISSQVRATFYLQSHLQQFRYTCPICQSLNSLVQNLAKMGKRHGLSTQTTCQRKQHRLWQYEAHKKHTYSFLVPVKRSWANLCRSPLPDSTQLKASSPEDELQQPEWQSTMCVRAAVHSYTNFSSSSAGQSSQSQHRQAHTHTHTCTYIHKERTPVPAPHKNWKSAPTKQRLYAAPTTLTTIHLSLYLGTHSHPWICDVMHHQNQCAHTHKIAGPGKVDQQDGDQMVQNHLLFVLHRKRTV